MSRRTQDVEDPEPEQGVGRPGEARQCRVCGIKLSAYNPNPHCWQHAIGHPWRGPTAKPKY